MATTAELLDLERRLTRLETSRAHTAEDIADIRETLREMRADTRITWGAIFTVALGLAAMMAKGFGWV